MTQTPGPPPPYYPPPVAYAPPARVEPVPGSQFGVAIPSSTPVPSGMAVGSLLVGIASILVSFAVACLGLAGSSAGWGAWAGGAFAVLSGLLGIGGIVLGVLGRRQVRRAAGLTGRGLATAGLICASIGLLFTLVAGVGAVLLSFAIPTQ
ncbi:hypothetical protein F4553_003917 [Allocatelliglobosispora scoriae]|uniref:DUF4190 domain-containing protein n=1 Tax=Allocatelliglobosispora scoriae TaxID=643052 RepID=A0A841BT10_9ACTN|nr:hypothetical protein [Allocatelliglobosispora scoriae]MBB5870538.1 hypothetical protein [Allocatelliglobosispora scoriae]